MTTTIKIFPSPGEGLKTSVVQQRAGDTPSGTETFLRIGDPEMVCHISGDQSVTVREVPDVPPTELKSDV